MTPRMISTSGLILALGVGICSTVSAEDCPPKACVPDKDESTLGPGGEACDPVFVTYEKSQDYNARYTQILRKGSSILSEVSLGDMSQSGERLAKALENAKNAAEARKVALEAWQTPGIPMEFQRHAIIYARSSFGTTAEADMWDGMLAGLADPDAELKKCHALARGNGLMKKKAAERLSILLQNPNLKEKLQ